MPDAKAPVPQFSAPGAHGECPHAWHSRPVFMALGGAVIMVMAIVLVAMWSERQAPPAASVGQLELLAMRGEIAGDTLVVVGLVRVPGLDSEDVAAVISTFGPQGQLVSRAEAPLPRADAPDRAFRIAVAGSAAAVRYHVSFRTPGGNLVRHVDRRNATRREDVPAGARS
jgi:hypothetical protein